MLIHVTLLGHIELDAWEYQGQLVLTVYDQYMESPVEVLAGGREPAWNEEMPDRLKHGVALEEFQTLGHGTQNAAKCYRLKVEAVKPDEEAEWAFTYTSFRIPHALNWGVIHVKHDRLNMWYVRVSTETNHGDKNLEEIGLISTTTWVVMRDFNPRA